jgi:hypothetical protein
MAEQTLAQAIARIDALKGDALNPRQAEAAGMVMAELGRLRVWGEAEYQHGYTDGEDEMRAAFKAEHAEAVRLRKLLDACEAAGLERERQSSLRGYVTGEKA